jgi:hypothetical protein
MTWKLARALRVDSAVWEQVALDARLQIVAGASLRKFSTRTHKRRARIAAELIARNEMVITNADDFTSVTMSYLATGGPDA